MALRSALKLNYKNETDKKIIETYCMSVIVLNLVDMQRADYQLKHGKYVDSGQDGPDIFLVEPTEEVKNELRTNLKRCSKKASNLLTDVKGNGNPEVETPLRRYLDNYTVPRDSDKQRMFVKLKDLSRKEQRALCNYVYTDPAERSSITLDKKQHQNIARFSSLPRAVKETLLDFYNLSPETQKALLAMETMTRKNILKRTQENLTISRKEPGEFTLSDADIHSIERKAMGNQINISGLRRDTHERYTSEKNAVRNITTKRIVTLALLLYLAGTVFHMGGNAIQDVGAIIGSNKQTAESLINDGLNYDCFNISMDTYNTMLSIQNTLKEYSLKQPTYEQQLELINQMSDSYKNVIEEKATAAFEEQHPNSVVSNLSFNNDEITISYAEDGKLTTTTLNVKDLPFQNANLSDLLNSFSTLQQVKTEVEKDMQIQTEIDTAVQNGLSTAEFTEYNLSENAENRISQLTDLHTTALNATALNLTLRDNLLFKDQFITTPQEDYVAVVTPEPIDKSANTTIEQEQEATPSVPEFFNVNDFKNKDVLTHLKQFFTREHNVVNPTAAVSSHDITITKPEQNYAYFVTVGEKSYIMTHGSYPAGVKDFLEAEAAKGNLTYQATGAIDITQVVKSANVYDDNGNHQSSIMVDGAAHYNGQVYPVISGNFHKTCLDPNYQSVLANKYIFAAAEAMFAVKTPYPTSEYHIDKAKEDYADALNTYCNEQGYTIESMPSNLVTQQNDDMEIE